MARVHISSFKEVIVLVVARCLWQGKYQCAPLSFVVLKALPAYSEHLLSKDSIEGILGAVSLRGEKSVSCKSQIKMAQTRTPAREIRYIVVDGFPSLRW